MSSIIKVNTFQDANGNALFNSDGSGTVTLDSNFSSAIPSGGDNTPSFKATMSASHGITDAVYTKVQFNTESFDTDSAYDHSTNYRFTVPSGEGGKYYLTATIQPDSTGAGQLERAGVAFYVNGAQEIKTETKFDNNPVYFAGFNLSTILTLSAGDYVEVYGYADDNSGGPIVNAGNQNEFSGYKLIGV